jgi:hypothetical protein
MSDTNLAPLTEDQVWQTLEFAQSLYGRGQGKFWDGLYNPFTQNENLIRLNNLPSGTPTLDSIQKELATSKFDTTTLQGYSEFLQTFDRIYAKTIDYFANMLAFDLRYTCTNAYGSDYNSKEYKDDVKRMYKFLDKFDYKSEFGNVVRQLLRTGVSYNWLRDSVGSYNKDEDALDITKARSFSLQMLPQDMCMITGYASLSDGSGAKTPIFDFDMDYFLHSTIDIKLFDPWFMIQLNKMWDETKSKYVPHAQMKAHKGLYVNWTQTSPAYGAWCFKFDLSNMAIIPPLASMLKSVVDNDTVKQLQIDKDMIGAYYILAGEIGMMDGLKSGDKKNQTKFDPKNLGQFMSLVTSGLQKNVKAVAMPLENIRGWQFTDNNPSMAINQTNTTASEGASASRLIYTSSAMSIAELQNAIITDYNFMATLYPQFANFLEYFINRKTKKFKFKFTFSGSTYPFEREVRTKAINELASIGLTPNESAWASAYGYAPQEFARMLDEAHNGDLQDKLTILANLNTMNTTEVGNTRAQGGRPKTSDSEITDKGAESRDA